MCQIRNNENLIWNVPKLKTTNKNRSMFSNKKKKKRIDQNKENVSYLGTAQCEYGPVENGLSIEGSPFNVGSK